MNHQRTCTKDVRSQIRGFDEIGIPRSAAEFVAQGGFQGGSRPAKDTFVRHAGATLAVYSPIDIEKALYGKFDW